MNEFTAIKTRKVDLYVYYRFSFLLAEESGPLGPLIIKSHLDLDKKKTVNITMFYIVLL